MSKLVNVGLIGFGMAGSVFHAPFITNVPGLHLSKIRETRPENIAVANKRYPEATIVGSAKAIFEDAAIDLVVLATPNSSHLSLAKEALQAGKHVVVEKPFTVTSAEADELIALAESKGKLLTVFQNRRWDSDFKTILKIVSENLLGEVVEYEAHFDRFRNFLKPDTWKEEDAPGSGLLYDLGSHLIDQALCLFGLPSEVSADLRTQREDSQIVDNFHLMLYYPNLRVILRAGMLVREQGPRYKIYGDRGSFLKYGLDVQEAALKEGQSPKGNADWGIEPEAIWGKLNTDFEGLHIIGKIESEAGDYSAFYQNVYSAILGDEELEVKPDQARDTIRVIELAMQSHKEKRTIAFS
ncbi:oxidoreductase [Pontibacter diazotrophicus]|uniref:Oxidoreductase n=1 Tax=Pontibacter diazotrophicus TaxID=1400979 RepID=A0A3D8L9M7_9BACT|nr:oxidoreductase [Pontibacter diazotrophicus]RDV14077.1 oxidoreductase [Pontibacter diazotrophicus]